MSTNILETGVTAQDGADLQSIADMAKTLFAALPSGAIDPKLLAGVPAQVQPSLTAPETAVPAQPLPLQLQQPPSPTNLSEAPLSNESLPHYLTQPALDSPTRPYSPALGGFGRPFTPPEPQQLSLLNLSTEIPCESGLKPQRNLGVPMNLGASPMPPPQTGLGGVPYAADDSFYFLRPQGAPLRGAGRTELPAASSLPISHASGFDAKRYHGDFPILKEIVNGKKLIWLDNAATTQKPQAVIDRLSCFYEHENSNIHRAAHELAARSTDAYEAARESVRRFLNAPSADDIVFVRGTTEAINLVAQSWGRDNLGPGDSVLISHLEHHANIVPWVRLADELGFKLKVAPVNDRGEIILEEYAKLLTSGVKLVSFTHVSNALGTVTPAKIMIDIAHAAGAKVLLDGAQSVSHMPVDVIALNPDFFVFSGHKVFGPTGIGALYGRADILESMSPWQGGGNMIDDVTFDHITYQKPPMKFEAGTGNIADAVGLGAALDYVMSIGMPAIAAHEHDLLVYGTHLLSRIKGVKIIGTAHDKAGVISFVMDNVAVLDIGKSLSAEGIAVRAGHHCAQPILRRMGYEATVRPSLALYNTYEDLDALAKVVHRLSR